jgi:oligopeptidase B
MYTKMDIKAPVCAKKPHEITTHGDTRIDNYYWLNQREDEEVLNYLRAENEYKDQMMAHLKDLQEDLFEEIKGRIKQTDMSVPYKDNGYFYFTKYNEGQEYPIYVRKRDLWKLMRKFI